VISIQIESFCAANRPGAANHRTATTHPKRIAQ